MTALVLLISLSVLILLHELGHFVVARRFGVRVERFSIGFGPVLWTWRRGDTDYALSVLPLGGYVKMAGEQPGGAARKPWEYGSRPVGQRAGIVLAGPLVNYLMGIGLFIGLFGTGYPALAPQVGTVLEGYPAALAGLQPRDRILAVDGAPVESWDGLTERIRRQTSGAPVQFRLQRAGLERVVTVSPRIRSGRTPFGWRTRMAVVGMTPSGEVHLVRYGWPRAIVEGVRRAWWLTVMTFQSLWQLLTGMVSMKESLTGPVGIFYLTSSAARLGWRYLVQLFAVLSVSLAIFNVLPIPVLDGGHLFFLGWEGLRRRPVSVRVQETLTQVGVCLLLGMLLFVTYNDVIKFQLVQRLGGWFK